MQRHETGQEPGTFRELQVFHHHWGWEEMTVDVAKKAGRVLPRL